MEHNRELELAWEFVEHTGMSVFLTGKAGTGKTTFLRTLRRQSAKSMVVVAPTGVAAINAGGVTIHSFFQLPLSPFVPGADYRDKFNFSREKLRIIRALDLLVIDEISMVRSDLLDAIDNALRKYRRSSRPFGGVQLLMIGDLQQLSPVVSPQDEALLRGHYPTPYFFGSNALASMPYVTIELTKVYRQQDNTFVELLNHVRENRLNATDRELLAARLSPMFRPAPDSGFIRLTTHNHSADSYNTAELGRITAPSFRYTAKVEGTFPEYSYPTADNLELKVGAQVMFVKNDASPERRFYNGKIGHVIYADSGCVKVLCPGEDDPVTVLPQVWENVRYTVNEQTNKIDTEVLGTFTQLPLRLAWAITIHKSQGLTFDKVIIDAGASFAPGQVYVALSRCRTLEGIVLVSRLDTALLGPDPHVEMYIARQDGEAAESFRRLPEARKEYHRGLVLELFSFAGLVGLQASLARVLSQTFAHSFPEETERQQQIAVELREKIVDVADKWIAMLSNMPFDNLYGRELLERVGKSAVYFRGELANIFDGTLQQTQKVKTENKKATQRVKELVGELRQELDRHLYILGAVADEGFSVGSYLRLKQTAMLDSSRESALKKVAKGDRLPRRRRQPGGKSEAVQKEKKQPSHLVTLEMFGKGMTRAEIAKERGLVLNTITGHLMKCVSAGDITLEDVFTPVTVNAVTSALQRVAPDAGYTEIRAMLPDSIPDVDFVWVWRSLRQNAGKDVGEVPEK